MIVTDASVLVDLLLGNLPDAGLDVLREHDFSLAAPHLVDVEITHTLRRWTLAGQLSPQRALTALQHLSELDLTRYPHTALVGRAFALRTNATSYDAMYLVLAEGLATPLVTRDAALKKVPGVRADVVVV